MKESNRAILDECRQHWEFYERTQTIHTSGGMHAISYHQLKELERIMDEEFLPGYTTAITGCGDCIGTHLKRVYYEYDNWIKRQPVVVAATFPVNDPPKYVDGPLEDEVVQKDNPEVFESVISKRAEKRKQDSLKRHGK